MVTNDLWQRAQDVFDQVRQLPPDRRMAELDAVCAGNTELRTEVESLLEHDTHVGPAFLESPGARLRHRLDCAERWATELLGSRIGHYQLVRLIAAGGMGFVFEARQEHPDRAVALKLMRPGIGASSALARFRIEPEILGRLQHPNIAQVYEAGVHDDAHGPVPYFAMELISRAAPITTYANARKLTLAQRLELFAKVCDAVQLGHQKGIIHRDLKPANILVGESGQPKVIDFGVARATDADIVMTTQCTQAGDLVGTVRYMSPEQCDGDPAKIDTRSDVYSLGVVLYELVTGGMPYELQGTTVYAAIRVIKDDPPRRPSEHNRALRGDMEAILLRALEKECRRRYQSVEALALDIRRYLNREPIDARSPNALAKVIRWGCRHPFAVTTAASLLIGLGIVGGTAVSIHMFNSRPTRVQCVDGGRAAQLISRLGGVLHTWSTSTSEGIRLGELVREPDERGNRQLAILAFADTLDLPNVAGSICAFDANGDLQEPLWRKQIEADASVPRYEGDPPWTGAEFGLHRAYIADIFPQAIGPEIVAVFAYSGGRARAVIRIYDLTGTVCFEIWNRSAIDSIYWNARSQLLIFSGTRAGETLDQMSFPEPEAAGQHPAVVFAIQPVWNQILHEDLEIARDGERPIKRWYNTVEPVVEVRRDRCRTMFSPPTSPSAVVRVMVKPEQLQQTNAGVNFEVDAAGEIVPHSTIADNFYEAARREKTMLPAPERFRLGPYPPTPSSK